MIRFMSVSLSNLVDNLFQGNDNDKCTDCTYLDYMSIQDDQLMFKCLEYNQNY